MGILCPHIVCVCCLLSTRILGDDLEVFFGMRSAMYHGYPAPMFPGAPPAAPVQSSPPVPATDATQVLAMFEQLPPDQQQQLIAQLTSSSASLIDTIKRGK
jgi:hypothetical protein